MKDKKNYTELLSFAYFPTYDESVKFLAESLAEKEEWDFTDSQNKNYGILKNYLEHTYRRLKQEDKISFTNNNSHACFNTGLITENLEDIFALFEKNKNTGPGCQQFFFRAFLKRSDNQIIKYFSATIPEPANYFQKPEQLLFNPNCNIVPDYDHILKDRVERFPAHLKDADLPELRRQLVGGIEDVRKKVRTNYTIAVPQCYRGQINLLLPLCLTSGSKNPDLALTIFRVDPNTYSAKTCLTLRMAYQAARLITKPQSNWLKP